MNFINISTLDIVDKLLAKVDFETVRLSPFKK